MKKKKLITLLIIIPLLFIIIGTATVFGLSFETYSFVDDAMEPTYQKDSSITVINWKKKIQEIKRFDVIVFVMYNDVFISRVIGMPNEIIELKSEGPNYALYINNIYYPEDYLETENKNLTCFTVVAEACNGNSTNVTEGNLYVLNDNRSNVLDSRNGSITLIPYTAILGVGDYPRFFDIF
ncbi:MAG: signal peptidase I [Bacillales bacterium]|nr:signal peptidase I [Bacillales bacterium]